MSTPFNIQSTQKPDESHMLGHSSLQMIFTKYYAGMPKETRNDGSAMMRAYESVQVKKEMILDRSKGDSESRICVPPPPATLIPD